MTQWPTLGFRVTPEQAATVHEAAQRAGITTAALLHALVANATNNFQQIQIPEKLPKRTYKPRRRVAVQQEIA